MAVICCDAHTVQYE